MVRRIRKKVERKPKKKKIRKKGSKPDLQKVQDKFQRVKASRDHTVPEDFNPSFEEAKKYKMPFGIFKDQTLDDIAKTDRGLKYLDWAAGEFDESRDVTRMIWAYLDNETIQKDLEQLLTEE